MNSEAMRAEFERYSSGLGINTDRHESVSDWYADRTASYMWRAWKAASAARQPVDSSWSMHDRIEFALRDAGFALDEASKIATLVTHPAPAAVPVDGPSLRMIRDAVRSAYDAGYNDARNAQAKPGDSAPGYSGRTIESFHGEALAASLSVMAGAAAMRATNPQPAAAKGGDA